jgi:hypothetical protein
VSEVDQLPVALFVYRRHDLLPRTLQCLREAGVDALYVFSDGAPDEAAATDVERVREHIAAIDWIAPVLIERERNVGLSESIRTGLDWLFERHDRAIVVEDDICVAREFTDYARQALEHYRDAPAVAGLTGLRLPFGRRAFDGYPYDVFQSPRFSSWGWATWGDRWRAFCFDPAELRREIEAATSFDPERAGADVPGMIEAAILKETLHGSWDVVCNANMLLRGQYFVTPTWNMIENTGLARGTHSDRAPRWELHWEPQHRPTREIRFAPVEESEVVLSAYRRFFRRRPLRELVDLIRLRAERTFR